MVLDHGRISLALPRGADRGFAQMALLALMVLAFGAILIARLPGTGGSGDGGVAGSTTSPSGSFAASPTAGETTPGPATARPTATSEPGASAQPTSEPAPTAAPGQGGTYTVQAGDTLSGIAADKGTTWQILAELNDIEDPSGLRVGTVLVLP